MSFHFSFLMPEISKLNPLNYRSANKSVASFQNEVLSRMKSREFRIADRGLIFDAGQAGADRAISYTVSLHTLRSGTILAGWQNGPGKHTPTNTIRISRSVDGGVTWQVLPHQFSTTWNGIPGSLLCAPMAETEPGRILLMTTWFDRSDPLRPLFDPETSGLLRSRQLFCFSDDEGDSWSEWQEMPTGELTGCAVSGPIARWPDGTIAVSFESFREFDDPRPLQPAAWLCLSHDQGRSFSRPQLMAQDPAHQIYYWDQRIWPATDPQSVIAMYWTHDCAAKHDLNVHWIQKSLHQNPPQNECPVDTGLQGQIAAPFVDEHGRLFALIVDRRCPGTISLYQSVDQGRTWPKESRLVIHKHDERAAVTQGYDNIDFAKYWEDMGKWSFGHPAVCPVPAGWLLAWYAGTPERMSVHWARLEDSSVKPPD